MLGLRLYKILICSALCFLSACSSVIPSNYLSSTAVKTPIRSNNGKWKYQQIIPISAATLNSPEGAQLLAPVLKTEPYHIGPYDGLNIIVWGHPEISTTATAPTPVLTTNTSGLMAMNSMGSNSPIVVQADGTIFYPYVGKISILGLTIDEVQNKIMAKLAHYIRNPQVSVQVAVYRQRNVYVLGEVVKPGSQPLTDKPLTMLEALSSAEGLDLTSSDPSHIFLIRGSFSEPQIYWLNATTPQALMIAQQIPLRENDILYVTAATFSGFNRAINQILPSVNSYIIAKGLINK